MYKCLDCGHIFEEGEQDIIREYHSEIEGGFYEEFVRCPICGGDFTETTSCKKCHGEFLEDELISGYYCEDCLREALTIENFLRYAEYSDKHLEESDVHTVEHFMLVWVYGLSDNAITGSSKEFRALMMAKFKNAASAHNKDEFLEQIWQYMEDYKILDYFSEWLYDKEVKK